MKRDKRDFIDISSEMDRIKSGEGFYGVCKAEYEKEMRPARKNLNLLKELFPLISYNHSCINDKGNGFYKLSAMLNRVLTGDRTDNWENILRKLKVKIARICEEIKRKKRDEFDNLFNEVNNSTEGDNFELNNNQKNIIYNMLIANGVTHEEAIEELLKY